MSFESLRQRILDGDRDPVYVDSQLRPESRVAKTALGETLQHPDREDCLPPPPPGPPPADLGHPETNGGLGFFTK